MTASNVCYEHSLVPITCLNVSCEDSCWRQRCSMNKQRMHFHFVILGHLKPSETTVHLVSRLLNPHKGSALVFCCVSKCVSWV